MFRGTLEKWVTPICCGCAFLVGLGIGAALMTDKQLALVMDREEGPRWAGPARVEWWLDDSGEICIRGEAATEPFVLWPDKHIEPLDQVIANLPRTHNHGQDVTSP